MRIHKYKETELLLFL